MEENLKILMPNYEKYLNNSFLLSKCMKHEISFKADMLSKNNLFVKHEKHIENLWQRNPTEAALIVDHEKLRQNILMKTPMQLEMDELSRRLNSQKNTKNEHEEAINQAKEKLIKSEDTYYRMLHETDTQYKRVHADLLLETAKKAEY